MLGAMGQAIDRDRFTDDDARRFELKLADDLEALRLLLARPGFGEGTASVGAELELNLIDDEGRPAPINRAVLAATIDRRVTLEVDRFNLEVNTDPLPLRGRPFSRLAASLEDALGEIRRAAAGYRARVVAVGILPTLTEADLVSSALTETKRYRALSAGMLRLRKGAFPVRIEGRDCLAASFDDVTLEGANTSFQVHLRVSPDDFARTYNAAQLAIAPVLAVSGNSPLFLGRRLWDETRVALFRQSADDRASAGEDDWRPARVSFGHGWARRGAYELFAEAVALHAPLLPLVTDEDPLAVARAGGTPALRELRLHQGTVWRWTRAIFDDAAGGHLRVEMRALPAGPTTTDMTANAAFLVGLVRGIRDQADELVIGCTFGQARRNFYEAARHGPDAELLWPDAPGGPVRPVVARELCVRLAPLARRGLELEGVSGEDIEHWIGIFEARARTGLTGARWQMQQYDLLRATLPPAEAASALIEQYRLRSEGGRPVHTWDQP